MAVRLDIIPSSRSINMFGTVHTSTAYSLSGNVLITVTPHTSLLTGAMIRPASLRLTSLSIVFEGKSECLSELIGYEGARLCRIEKTLVGQAPSESSSSADIPAHPMTLSCAGGDNSETFWQWTVLFDLAIPGWLPASLDVEEFTETSYSLHAFATFETIEPPVNATYKPSIIPPPSYGLPQSHLKKKASGWSLPSLPALFSSTVPRTSKQRREVSGPVTIAINRFRTPRRHVPNPGAEYTPLFPLVHEQGSLGVGIPHSASRISTGGIPLDLLRGLSLAVSFPEYVDIEEGVLPLGLRLRCLPEHANGRILRLLEFEVQVEQTETFRSVPDRSLERHFPIPPSSEQPSSLPLLNPHQTYQLANECNLFPLADPENLPTKATRRQMLIPEGQIHYRPAHGGQDGITLDARWARMDVDVPILRARSNSKADDTVEQEDGVTSLSDECSRDRERRRAAIRPGCRNTFAHIEHTLTVFVRVAYDPSEAEGSDSDTEDENDENAMVYRETLHCSFPLRFTRAPDDVKPRPQPASFAMTPASSSELCISPLSPSLYQPSSSPSSTTSFSPLSSLFSFPPSPFSPSSLYPPSPTSFPSCQLPPPILPAYTQLFHENGERREDDLQQYGCWLPPYIPSEEPPRSKSITSIAPIIETLAPVQVVV